MAMAPLYERRVGPHKVAIPEPVAPWSRWDPVLPGTQQLPARSEFVRSDTDPGPLPANDEDIAFANVTQLSRWIEPQAHVRAAHQHLSRAPRKVQSQAALRDHADQEHALQQAKQADQEIAAGKYRGPLHGIPWGAKDLLDTAGIPTTYGAEPFRNRIPKENAVVVQRLNDAGAVLVAKLSLGALALNDIWFGGQTMNPWLLDEGSSGSSAGPGAATAAGLVGIRHRQRDRRQHRQSVDALRRHRTASDLRPRGAHRRDDAVLVAGQAGPDGAQRRRHDSGAEHHLAGPMPAT